MTPTEQLTERLEALGMTVDGIFPARGYWTHMRQDVMRWTAHVRIAGTPGIVTIGSWHTITACARRGISYDPKADGDRGSITANDPQPCRPRSAIAPRYAASAPNPAK